MSRGAATREAIIEEALSQAVAIGLEGISVGVLAANLNLSKSGLFAHFKSKEALQLAVLEAAIDRFQAHVVAPAVKLRGAAALAKLFSGYLDWIKAGAGAGGCLFVTAAQEFDDRPGPVRDRLVESQRQWRALLNQVVGDASTAGAFRKDADPDLATFEFIGLALAYQHAMKLLEDRRARTHAERGFERLLLNLRAGS